MRVVAGEERDVGKGKQWAGAASSGRARARLFSSCAEVGPTPCVRG